MNGRSTASGWIVGEEKSFWGFDPHWLLRLLPGSETSFLHPQKPLALE